MSNFHNNQSNFHQGQKQSAFKIWHAKNHNETIISLTSEFCRVIQNAILSNYCENKALVAFAKQLSSNSETRPNNKNLDRNSFNRRNDLSYGRKVDDYDNSIRRGHHADVEDYFEDLE